ncbi:MAG: hypothetical protein B7Z55_18985, partial [Planctomycetales bacterium 12-60-4]
SDLIGSRIELSVPAIRTSSDYEDSKRLIVAGCASPLVVLQEFSGPLSGRSALAFPESSGLILAALLTGEESIASELDVEVTGVLLEVGNILLNSVLGTLANEAGCALDYMLPELYCGPDAVRSLLREVSDEHSELLIADVNFHVDELATNGSVVIVFSCGSILRLVQNVESQLIA